MDDKQTTIGKYVAENPRRCVRLLIYDFKTQGDLDRQIGSSMGDGVKIVSTGTIRCQTLDPATLRSLVNALTNETPTILDPW